MFPQGKTVLLGKRFPRPHLGASHPMSEKEAQALQAEFLPEQKPAWTLRKDTELVVAGDDAGPAALEEARSRGLEVLAPTQWLGCELALGAPSIGALLRELVGAGFRFNTACNEADGSTEVITVPLRPAGAAPACASGAPALPQVPEQRAVPSTRVAAAVERVGGWLTERARPVVASPGPSYARTAVEPAVWHLPVSWSHGQPN